MLCLNFYYLSSSSLPNFPGCMLEIIFAQLTDLITGKIHRCVRR